MKFPYEDTTMIFHWIKRVESQETADKFAEIWLAELTQQYLDFEDNVSHKKLAEESFSHLFEKVVIMECGLRTAQNIFKKEGMIPLQWT